MRFLRTILVIIFISLPLTGFSSEISEELQAQMNLTQSNQLIRVWLELPKVVDKRLIHSMSTAARQSRAERYTAVVGSLKNSHEQAQQSLLNYLHGLPQTSVQNIKPHWMVNIIDVELSVVEIEKLSSRSDIIKIQTIPQLVSIEPEDVKTSSSKATAGIESNLTYINAPVAWGMGFTGAGSVVCSFDTGVDGEHPALKHSWKGLDGDSLAAWFDPSLKVLAPHSFTNCIGSVCRYHGTHTMGLMVGIDTLTGDTVGVAPEAKWISAAVIDVYASIIDAFEWAADPDGNPNTIDDLPDVINHSWGVPNIDCKNIFYDLIENSEALGTVNIFAAGNEGTSGASTIRNPANRANDSLDCFAVGNLDHTTGLINNLSSRGPSICPLGKIKPNVSAPGVTVRSTMPNGLYSVSTGTSMAAPHVSGLVALLRQKNPNATVAEIKEAILTSAIDMGSVGPDNDYGWGRIDCVAALTALSAVNTTPNFALYSFDTPPIVAGDTVVGTIVIQNTGALASNVSATIIGLNSALHVISGFTALGDINEGDTLRAVTTFDVAIDDTLLAGTILSLDVELVSDELTDTIKIYFLVEPKTSRSFVTHNVGNIEFSLSNFGAFGFNALSVFPVVDGRGFRYTGGPNELYEGGLLIGLDSLQISDGVFNVAQEPDGDFQIMPGGDIRFVSPKIGVTQQTYAKFSDSRAENPIGLEVVQQSYAFDYGPYQDLLILRYLIRNNSGAAVNNLNVSIYMNWDVEPVWWNNVGGYELFDKFSWLATDSSGIIMNYRGVKVLQPSPSGSFTETSDFIDPGFGALDGFTENDKAIALSNGFIGSETFKTSKADLLQFTTAQISLADGQTDTVAFALIAGDTYPAIQQTSMDAESAYAGFVTDIGDDFGPGELPQSFSLNQNFPNPFNPTTSIQFELPNSTEYNFEIFNLVGQKVFNQRQTAEAGVHTIIWDASDVASGIYLYKLTTDSFSQSRKMLLLK